MSRWLEHLDMCDQCNYDRPCLVCDGGLGRAELDMSDDEVWQCHSCNCHEGAGIGYLLWLEHQHENEINGIDD